MTPTHRTQYTSDVCNYTHTHTHTHGEV